MIAPHQYTVQLNQIKEYIDASMEALFSIYESADQFNFAEGVDNNIQYFLDNLESNVTINIVDTDGNNFVTAFNQLSDINPIYNGIESSNQRTRDTFMIDWDTKVEAKKLEIINQTNELKQAHKNRKNELRKATTLNEDYTEIYKYRYLRNWGMFISLLGGFYLLKKIK